MIYFMIYPLVNCYITMGQITIVHGKIHEISMAMFKSYGARYGRPFSGAPHRCPPVGGWRFSSPHRYPPEIHPATRRRRCLRGANVNIG